MAHFLKKQKLFAIRFLCQLYVTKKFHDICTRMYQNGFHRFENHCCCCCCCGCQCPWGTKYSHFGSKIGTFLQFLAKCRETWCCDVRGPNRHSRVGTGCLKCHHRRTCKRRGWHRRRRPCHWSSPKCGSGSKIIKLFPPKPVWPDLAKFGHFGKKIKCLATIEGLFSIRHGLKPTLANVKYYCANFPGWKWPNIEQVI